MSTFCKKTVGLQGITNQQNTPCNEIKRLLARYQKFCVQDAPQVDANIKILFEVWFFEWILILSDPRKIYINKTVLSACLFATYRPHAFPGATLRDRGWSGVRASQSRLTPAPWRVGAQRSVDAHWSWEARWALSINIQTGSLIAVALSKDQITWMSRILEKIVPPCFCESFGNDSKPLLNVLLSRRKIISPVAIAFQTFQEQNLSG